MYYRSSVSFPHLQIYNNCKFMYNKWNNDVLQQKRSMSFAKWYRGIWTPKKKMPPYKHITQIGDPILRNIAAPVPLDAIKSDQVYSTIKTLRHVMKRYNSMGLAAPQIGVSLRIFAIEFDKKRVEEYTSDIFKVRDMEIVPFKVFINPEMKVLNYEKLIYPEACESFRGYCAEVARYREVSLTGFGADGKPINMRAKGWTARIIQHEMDHLNGKLYTDIMDKSTLACGCWEAVNRHAGRIEIRFIP